MADREQIRGILGRNGETARMHRKESKDIQEIKGIGLGDLLSRVWGR